MNLPVFEDVARAQTVVDAYRLRTPLWPSPALGRLTGCDVWLKLECLAPIGSFKGRGAINRVAAMTDAEKPRGVITASTGNHGGAVAWAAKQCGVAATVVLPVGVPEIKWQTIEDAGARIIIEGANWNASCAVARSMAQANGMLYLEDGEDPAIMAGAGTVAYEILNEKPEIEVMVVPVGGGNFIAGCGIAARGLKPSIRLVGVQSEAALGVWQSWQEGRVVSAPCETFAGGIATTGPVEAAFGVMQKTVDTIKLVSEDELMHGIALIAKHHALIVEGAAAAPLAALLRYPTEFAGRRVALVLSGRNLDAGTLGKALTMV
ncbi:MAG: pyridoxal-phosphate dependent enzyme [Chloroflexi bacterium]|nr:pyridoxal-phosphate dependent enzyme [Chloroflexota bacterium]